MFKWQHHQVKDRMQWAVQHWAESIVNNEWIWTNRHHIDDSLIMHIHISAVKTIAMYMYGRDDDDTEP